MKPSLIVITGRPASGKTTLARILSQRLSMPLLVRDDLKAGYVRNKLTGDTDADLKIYEVFFQAIRVFLTGGVSVIAEAAFQHRLWVSQLNGLHVLADVRIILCDVAPGLAKTRFSDRLASDPARALIHKERPLNGQNEDVSKLIEDYEAPKSGIPLLKVETTEGYDPGIDAILSFLEAAGRGSAAVQPGI